MVRTWRLIAISLAFAMMGPSQGLGADFRLTDSAGRPVKDYDAIIKVLAQGDHVWISPAPGMPAQEFVLGPFLGQGHTTKIFGLEGRPAVALRLPIGTTPINQYTRATGFDFLEATVHGEEALAAEGIPHVRLLPGGGKNFLLVDRLTLDSATPTLERFLERYSEIPVEKRAKLLEKLDEFFRKAAGTGSISDFRPEQLVLLQDGSWTLADWSRLGTEEFVADSPHFAWTTIPGGPDIHGVRPDVANRLREVVFLERMRRGLIPATPREVQVVKLTSSGIRRGDVLVMKDGAKFRIREKAFDTPHFEVYFQEGGDLLYLPRDPAGGARSEAIRRVRKNAAALQFISDSLVDPSLKLTGGTIPSVVAEGPEGEYLSLALEGNPRKIPQIFSDWELTAYRASVVRRAKVFRDLTQYIRVASGVSEGGMLPLDRVGYTLQDPKASLALLDLDSVRVDGTPRAPTLSLEGFPNAVHGMIEGREPMLEPQEIFQRLQWDCVSSGLKQIL